MPLTGKDKLVSGFMDNDEIMQDFLANVFSISDKAVENYIQRNFSNLMISFGCTGGQHRSVYSAEKLKEHLESKYKDKIKVLLQHNEFPELNN
jgi:RNase adaptor protein for sRNA GlmZ degradation